MATKAARREKDPRRVRVDVEAVPRAVTDDLGVALANANRDGKFNITKRKAVIRGLQLVRKELEEVAPDRLRRIYAEIDEP